MNSFHFWKTGTPTIIEKATVSRSELNEMNVKVRSIKL
jgi:hypothetical protein